MVILSLTFSVNKNISHVDILFRTNKLKRECCEKKRGIKRWGPRRAKLIGSRLDDLHAAETLEDIRPIPQARCHELTGKYQGQLSVDLDHPYRLLFEPADDPIPRKLDGGLDWSQVRIIRILSVEDTHE